MLGWSGKPLDTQHCSVYAGTHASVRKTCFSAMETSWVSLFLWKFTLLVCKQQLCSAFEIFYKTVPDWAVGFSLQHVSHQVQCLSLFSSPVYFLVKAQWPSAQRFLLHIGKSPKQRNILKSHLQGCAIHSMRRLKPYTICLAYKGFNT